VLYCDRSLSFFGGVDPFSGVVLEKGHPLEGRSIAGTILVFPRGKGSTVGSYTLLRLKRSGTAPAAMVNRECDTVIAVGTILAGIPCVDMIDIELLEHSGFVVVDGDNGTVQIEGRQ